MQTQPRLLALTTAVPPFRLDQTEIQLRARGFFAGANALDIEHLLPVFANAGIDARYSCVPLEWYDRHHGWAERNALYLRNALDLLEQASRQALKQAGLEADSIDAVVVVSTTGIATPSLDAMLVGRLGLRADIRRLPVFGLGCAGGVLGLARAADFARAWPGTRTLFLVVELCALSFRRSDASKSNVVATALFGDGAACAIIGCDGDGPVIGTSGEHTWPDSLGIMGWDVAEDGLKAIFSRDIPALVRRDLREAALRFLARAGVELANIRHFICHPGGAKVLAALEEAFGLDEGAMRVARGVLRDYGNMSAATALFVLEQALASGAKGPMLMSALGPGFTAGFLLLDPP